jgi:hypothetical protein
MLDVPKDEYDEYLSHQVYGRDKEKLRLGLHPLTLEWVVLCDRFCFL